MGFFLSNCQLDGISLIEKTGKQKLVMIIFIVALFTFIYLI